MHNLINCTQTIRLSISILFLSGLIGCSVNYPATNKIDLNIESNLPEPDTKLSIAQLVPCNDNDDQVLEINSNHPINILVHGCHGSAGRFKALADVLAFHGQQSACFTYNDRLSLMTSSRQLASTIETLNQQVALPKINILGHSLGGLVARKALIDERELPINSRTPIELVTVSAPFAGIRVAQPCVNPLLRIGTLGLNDLACRLISGDKWYEITNASKFIQQPGTLNSVVNSHLLVATDEQNSCRRYNDDGRCIASDFIFTLDEQQLNVSSVDLMKAIEVKAGHVEIVGENGVIPRKLINILQQEGYIKQTPEDKLQEFNALLSILYNIEKN